MKISHLISAKIWGLCSAISLVFYTSSFAHHPTKISWAQINSHLQANSLYSYKDTLYAGTTGGVLKTTNAAEKWELVNDDLKNSVVTTLYAEQEHFYIGTTDGVISIPPNSTDGYALTEGLDSLPIMSLSIYKGALYAGTFANGIVTSINAGKTWNRINHDIFKQTDCVYTLQPYNGFLYAGILDKGVFKSNDVTSKWRSANNGLSAAGIISVKTLYPYNGYLYAGTSDGIFRTDPNDHWDKVNIGLATVAITVTVLHEHDHYLYAGTNKGIFRTNDGLTWEAVNEGLNNVKLIYDLHTHKGSLYASTDRGIYQAIPDNREYTQAKKLSYSTSSEPWFKKDEL